MDVAQVAQDVHRLVVADERVHTPPGLQRRWRERDEQLHHLARIGAAIEDVTSLHEVGASPRPARPAIDHPGLSQHGDELLVVAVHVAHRHDALDTGEDVLAERRPAEGDGDEERCDAREGVHAGESVR